MFIENLMDSYIRNDCAFSMYETNNSYLMGSSMVNVVVSNFASSSSFFIKFSLYSSNSYSDIWDRSISFRSAISFESWIRLDWSLFSKSLVISISENLRRFTACFPGSFRSTI
jgi:hypothetical protein